MRKDCLEAFNDSRLAIILHMVLELKVPHGASVAAATTCAGTKPKRRPGNGAAFGLGARRVC